MEFYEMINKNMMFITAFDPVWDRPTFAGAVGGLALEASRYMALTGATQEDAARVSVRDRRHALNNPYAHLRVELTVEDIMKSPMIAYPLKYLDMCPRTDGACAVVFASEDHAPKITRTPAWIYGTSVRHNYTYLGDTDLNRMGTLEAASQELYGKLGIKEPLKEFDVMELYLPYSFAGLIWIEALGLAKMGEAPRLVWDGVTDMGGELPINFELRVRGSRYGKGEARSLHLCLYPARRGRQPISPLPEGDGSVKTSGGHEGPGRVREGKEGAPSRHPTLSDHRGMRD